MTTSVLRYFAVAAVFFIIVTSGCHQPAREVFPGVRWEKGVKEIAVDGAMCIDRGILEYLAVAEGGKEYESVLRVYCQPSHLQQTLLMADCQVGNVPAKARGDFAPGEDGKSQRPPGAPQIQEPPADYESQRESAPTYFRIEVATKDNGFGHRQPIETYLRDRKTGFPPRDLRWAFTGSYFFKPNPGDDPVFAADRMKSVIGLVYDPSALLNTIEGHGNPYRGQHTGFELNPQNAPAKDTAVRLYLIPVELDED